MAISCLILCVFAPLREPYSIYRCSAGISSAGIIVNDGLVDVVAAPSPKAKSAFAEPFAATVTCIVFSVPFAPPSFQATTV